MKIFRKYYVAFVAGLVLLTLGLTAFQAQGALELPEEVVTALSAFVMVAVTGLAKWLFGKFGIDLKDNLAVIASGVVSVLVVLANHYLTMIPADYTSIAEGLLAFLIVFLSGNGTYGVLFRSRG